MSAGSGDGAQTTPRSSWTSQRAPSAACAPSAVEQCPIVLSAPLQLSAQRWRASSASPRHPPRLPLLRLYAHRLLEARSGWRGHAPTLSMVRKCRSPRGAVLTPWCVLCVAVAAASASSSPPPASPPRATFHRVPPSTACHLPPAAVLGLLHGLSWASWAASARGGRRHGRPVPRHVAAAPRVTALCAAGTPHGATGHHPGSSSSTHRPLRAPQ
jgi:hypothetical protein